MFGPGATQLAKELENISDKKEELMISDTENDSDSAVEHLNGSSPAKDQRKKRVRKNIKLGDLSSIQGMKDNSGDSSEGGNSEEASKGIKKPRLGGESSESREEDNTEELKEEDKIFEALLNLHEEVPLEDPGPDTTKEEGGEGAAGATQ